MIRKISTLALGAVMVCGLGLSPVQAAPLHFTLESPHTQIIFNVSHLGFSHSYGKFTGYSGNITFDPDAPASSSVDVTIDAKSLELNDQKWNDHVRNADFLDVEKYPTITFKSTKIEVTGEKTANITGDLTLHGVTKPVVLATTLNKLDKHPMSGKQVAGFSAKATVKRSEFGVSYGLPNVGDDLNIIIEVETVPVEAAPEAAPTKAAPAKAE